MNSGEVGDMCSGQAVENSPVIRAAPWNIKWLCAGCGCCIVVSYDIRCQRGCVDLSLKMWEQSI